MHPNADALVLAHVLGWQLVVKKGDFYEGQRVVYFPPDAVLPVELSDRLGVTKYLSNGRIRCAKLRGEPSFGIAIPVADPAWQLGDNVADWYGVTKYEPPLRPNAGDAETPHPLFVEYTNIENLRNFPTILQEREMIEITEKLHGTNTRVAIIEGEMMAGSNRLRRKRPSDDAFGKSTYWFPWSLPGVNRLMHSLAEDFRQVILYGEVYGAGIQSLNYGLKNAIKFAAFDLLVDGKYLDSDGFHDLCSSYGVETVPVLGRIPYTLDAVRAMSGGLTTLVEKDAHIREGVVVRPLHERTDPKTGRVILKYLSDQYLFGDASDFTDS